VKKWSSTSPEKAAELEADGMTAEHAHGLKRAAGLATSY
jgi:hypothetical protein